MTARRARLAAGAGLLGVLLAGCADVPEPAADAGTATGAAPAVLVAQSEQVRAEVAERLLGARVAGDPALLDAAATGPAALLEALRVRVDGPQPDAAAVDPVPAAVLVAPRASGWPRWFAAVTDPATAQELPVLELYASEAPRLPYRLWARLTMLPGAELPAFPAAEVGAVPLADGDDPDPSDVPSDPASGAALPPSAVEGLSEEDAELLTAVSGLAARYASVLTEGVESPEAASFEPDPFVEAVRARVEAEAAAVAGVATTTVVHEPLDGVEVLYAARTTAGDLLAVTAVQTTTTMTVGDGGGELRPGPELRAAAGIEGTDGTLTARSVAALAFVVPAEQGAIRLVAVGEGLVEAEAT